MVGIRPPAKQYGTTQKEHSTKAQSFSKLCIEGSSKKIASKFAGSSCGSLPEAALTESSEPPGSRSINRPERLLKWNSKNVWRRKDYHVHSGLMVMISTVRFATEEEFGRE
jgi:hypothetical protein